MTINAVNPDALHYCMFIESEDFNKAFEDCVIFSMEKANLQ